MALWQRRTGSGQQEIVTDDDTAALESRSQTLATRLAEAAQQGPLLQQVFISHAGQHSAAATFADSILKPFLEAAGLRVFTDCGSLEPDLIRAAANSAVMVVVLTMEYPLRYWCMLELSLALHSRSLAAKRQQQQEQQQPLVLPVFYDDVSQVVRLDDIKRYWQGPGLQHVPADRQDWVDPTAWAANISYMNKKLMSIRRNDFETMRDHDIQLARRVVVSAVEATRVSHNVYGLVQLEADLTTQLLPDPDRLGLWLHGVGGSGKTTLATLLFNRLTPGFQHRAFIELQCDEDIGSQQLTKMLKQLGAAGFNEDRPAGVLLKKLQDYVRDKAVLIVVDNVWTGEQLDQLLPRSFGQGSRVIITSRSSDMPNSQWLQQAKPQLLVHAMPGLTEEAAMQLLCASANMDPHIQLESEDLRDAVKQVVVACGGLPLALQLTGALLFCEDPNQTRPVAEWKEALAALQRDRSVIDTESRLVDILNSIFGALEPLQQRMFLDVAVALQGQPTDLAMAVWARQYGPHTEVLFKGLQRRNLLSTSSTGKLEMHDLLAALGRGTLLESSTMLPEEREKYRDMKDYRKNWLAELQAEREARQALYDRCGGLQDAAAMTDSLNVLPAAKGAASFLLHPDTAATTLAVYGRWGTGKSTFMRLVEQEMIIEEACKQVDSMERDDQGKLHKEYDKLVETLRSDSSRPKDQAEAVAKLQVLASPRLMTVSFNAWQYLTEGQVWGGLIVEVTQRLEEKLALSQRQQMARWWQGGVLWCRLMLWCANLRVALRYNWRKRRSDMILRFVLPIITVLFVVVPLAAWGSRKLWETAQQGGKDAKAYNVAAALTAVVGVLTPVFTVFERTMKVVKQVSDVLLEGKSFFTLKDHTDKIGYQHAVIQDLKELKLLLEKEMEWLAEYKADTKTCCCCLNWPFQREPAQEEQGNTETEQRPSPSVGPSSTSRLAPVARTPGPEKKEAKKEKELHTIRVVVFIDDVDRCKPSKVVEVLEAAHVVLANSSLSVVIGMDKGFVCNAISQAYKESLISIESAEEFLGKIVQVELTLPPPSRADLKQYINSLGEGMEDMEDPPSRDSEVVVVKGGGLEQPSQQPPQPQPRLPMGSAVTPSLSQSSLPQPGGPQPQPDMESPQQPPRERLQVLRSRVYTPTVKSILQFSLGHDDWLFENVTPREIKRLLNHYMLATYITLEREIMQKRRDEKQQEEQNKQQKQPRGKQQKEQQQQEFGIDKQRQLMAWCLLWWRHSRGMRLAVQCSSKELQATNSTLQQLVTAALERSKTKLEAARATASAAVEKSQGSTKDNKDDVEVRRLEAGKKDLESISKLLQSDSWRLSKGPCKGSHLWSIDRASLQQFRLFGMEVLSSDSGREDVEPSTMAPEAGAAPPTSPDPSGDSLAGGPTSAEEHDTEPTDSSEPHGAEAATTTAAWGKASFAMIAATWGYWFNSFFNTPGPAATSADDIESGASP